MSLSSSASIIVGVQEQDNGRPYDDLRKPVGDGIISDKSVGTGVPSNSVSAIESPANEEAAKSAFLYIERLAPNGSEDVSREEAVYSVSLKAGQANAAAVLGAISANAYAYGVPAGGGRARSVTNIITSDYITNTASLDLDLTGSMSASGGFIYPDPGGYSYYANFAYVGLSVIVTADGFSQKFQGGIQVNTHDATYQSSGTLFQQVSSPSSSVLGNLRAHLEGLPVNQSLTISIMFEVEAFTQTDSGSASIAYSLALPTGRSGVITPLSPSVFSPRWSNHPLPTATQSNDTKGNDPEHQDNKDLLSKLKDVLLVSKDDGHQDTKADRLLDYAEKLISVGETFVAGVRVGTDVQNLIDDYNSSSDSTAHLNSLAVDLAKLAGSVLSVTPTGAIIDTALSSLPVDTSGNAPKSLSDLLGQAAQGWILIGMGAGNLALSLYDQLQTANILSDQTQAAQIRSLYGKGPDSPVRTRVSAVGSASINLSDGPAFGNAVASGTTTADFSGLTGSLQAVLAGGEYVQTNAVSQPILFGANTIVGSAFNDIFSVQVGSGNWSISGGGGDDVLVVGATHNEVSLANKPDGSLTLTLNGTNVSASGLAEIRFEDGITDVKSSLFTPISPDTSAVYRFFNTVDGTHFFTSSATERDSIVSSRQDMTYEGVGINSTNPLTSWDPNAVPVYRFFSSSDGTHFYTDSDTEKEGVKAARPDLVFEGIGFYEHTTPRPNDAPVYRFFDTVHGTHLYISDATERASILSSRPDLTDEGIGFYAPKSS